MFYRERTTLGGIECDEKIIASILRRSLSLTGKHVMLSGPRGRLSRASQNDDSDDDSFIEIEMADDMLNIRIYIILRFGKSIKRTANEIDRRIRSDIENFSGFRVGRLTVVFAGVKSKNLSKRHIEVTTYAD